MAFLGSLILSLTSLQINVKCGLFLRISNYWWQRRTKHGIIIPPLFHVPIFVRRLESKEKLGQLCDSAIILIIVTWTKLHLGIDWLKSVVPRRHWLIFASAVWRMLRLAVVGCIAVVIGDVWVMYSFIYEDHPADIKLVGIKISSNN